MILVFTPKINNRIRYIFRLLFTDVLGIGVRLTENVNEFKSLMEYHPHITIGPKYTIRVMHLATNYFLCRNHSY